ncbi:MAG: 4Fe-4S dicluster domain-containing protein [Actinobacteria bacterium]|nr:4Fe-4S dicluster domain-containing protein [Actinomycetota bacterium]
MKKDLNRRDFLKISGGMIGLAIMSSSILNVLSRSRAKDSTQQTSNKALSQWCMVIDLRKCEGCVTIDKPPQCTQACIAMHFVPKEQKWIEVYKVEQPGEGNYFMPTPCYHCENAPCVKVCPVKATYHNEEGIVLVDHFRCIGCRLCMAACPYQRRFFNWGTPNLPPEAAFAKYSPEFPVPAKRGTVIKCIFCAHLLKVGKLPACVAGCPMKALYMGDFNRNTASNGVEVVQLSKFLDENNAYRYKEELGTQPRVWYLPGHGQLLGRHPDDLRELKSIVWKGSED